MNITLRAHPGSSRMQRVAAVQWMENLICNTAMEEPIITIDVPARTEGLLVAFSTITQTGGGKRVDEYIFERDGGVVVLHRREGDGHDDIELELDHRNIPGHG